MSAITFTNNIILGIKNSVGVDGSKYNSSTPNVISSAISNVITNYILSNLIVTVTYSGTLSGGGADPIVSDTFKVIGSCNSNLNNGSFQSWILDLQSKIALGFYLAPLGETAGLTPSNLVYPIKNNGLTEFINQNMLKNVHLRNVNNPQSAVWEVVCSSIINWINASASEITSPAIRTDSTGTLTVSVNNLS